MTTANGIAETNQTINGQFGSVRGTDINVQMQTAYLDYAMSVIVSRALPDVRDGLKPVHRRILYSMFRDLGLTSDKPHKKSARIVGEVLGKYHPHGDTAVYDSMVRMAQDFSLRYPLVDGQGNFGSIDGDNAAAMRYTEARLEQISNLMLTDLEKDTVDWHENFDSTLQEPDVLPAALPNLLINGSSGIAVGMATNIAPHNLAEVVDALAYMIDNYKRVDKITVEDLMQFIKGPDFPTGGILYRYRQNKKDEDDTDAIAQGYALGKSRLILQAKAHFEEMSRNRSRIVVTELPYQTNKTALIERIASLVRDGKIEGITDLRDESDRTGMRISVELTRTVDPKRILEQLFKYTPLQQTFGMQMLALVDGEPLTLSLKRMLHLFLQHRQEVIRRRSEYELAKAKQRAHILEGLIRALDILDDVIRTIRSSQRVETARQNLIREFKFSEIQAQAILDMQLRRLAALERKKLQDEYKEVMKYIKHLEGLLASPKKILQLIKSDLLEIKETYGDARRTQLVERTKGTLTSTDLLPDQEVWVSLSSSGELRRQDVSKISASTLRQAAKGADIALFRANTRDQLFLFSKEGRCRSVNIHEIPQNGTKKNLAELCEFTRRDTVTAALTLPRSAAGGGDDDGYLLIATEQGMVKRVTIADFIAAAGMDPIVMNVDPKDRLGWVLKTSGDQEVIFVTDNGQSIRFNENVVRSMGLGAAGVNGMKLKKDAKIVYIGLAEPDGELLTITQLGFAKRSSLSQYGTQGRNGGGIVTQKLTARTGNIASALVLSTERAQDDQQLVAIIASKGAPETLTLAQIPQMGRGVQGKLVTAKIAFGTQVVAVQMADDTIDDGPLPDSGSNGGPSNAKAAGQAASKAKAQAEATSARSRSRSASARAKPASAKRVAKAPTVTAAATKALPPKKATATQPSTTKSTGTKSTGTKSAGKKSATKPVAAKSLPLKKVATSKPAAQKTVAKQAVAKQTVAKKGSAKKSTTKAAAAKALPLKKVGASNPKAGKANAGTASSSKAATQKRAAKPTASSARAGRSSASKPVVKKTTTKQAASKKDPVKKPTTKAVAAKALPIKKVAAKPTAGNARTEPSSASKPVAKKTTTKQAASKTTGTKKRSAKSAVAKTQATKPQPAKATPKKQPRKKKSDQKPASSPKPAKVAIVASVSKSQSKGSAARK